MNGDEAGTLLKKQNAPVLEPKKQTSAPVPVFKHVEAVQVLTDWCSGQEGAEAKQRLTCDCAVMNCSSLLSSEEEDGGGVYVSAVSVEIHGFLEKSTRQKVERESLCQHPPHRA